MIKAKNTRFQVNENAKCSFSVKHFTKKPGVNPALLVYGVESILSQTRTGLVVPGGTTFTRKFVQICV